MIKHNPTFKEETVRKYYGNCKYVCTTQLGRDSRCWDIFYLIDGPNPKFGNRYFGLTPKTAEKYFICNADSIETESFTCIKDSKGDWHYSETGHHFNEVDTGAVDGGRRQFGRIVGTEAGFPETKVFVVKDGIFMEKQNETTTEV